MTRDPKVDPNPNWRAAHCVHCAAGVPLYLEEPTYHFAQHVENGPIKCTAPTPERYIANLESEHARMWTALEKFADYCEQKGVRHQDCNCCFCIAIACFAALDGTAAQEGK